MNDSSLAYGAESLKRKEMKHTFFAQTIALILIAGIFLFPLLKLIFEKEEKNSKIPVKVKKVVNYSELSAPPPIDLKQVQPKTFKAPPKVKTVKFLQPVAKKDEEVLDEEMLPSMDEMSSTQIADFEQDGVDSIMVNPEESIELAVDEYVKEEVYTFVQTMPEFPVGGESGLLNYLGENLRYPDIAKDAGLEGMVVVAFVVENDGSISNVQVVRGIADLLDKEALRVINNMPSWKPGEQNGQKVRVSYTVPIRFKLIDTQH